MDTKQIFRLLVTFDVLQFVDSFFSHRHSIKKTSNFPNIKSRNLNNENYPMLTDPFLQKGKHNKNTSHTSKPIMIKSVK